MKRTIFALAMLIGIIGCSDSDYKINGSITILDDGDTVSLYFSPNGRDMTAAESTTIANGKFEFTGKAKGCKRCYIVHSDTVITPFFLEKGEISIDVTDSDANIYGTHNNDLNTQIKRSLLNSTAEIRTGIGRIKNDSTLTTEEKRKLSAEIEKTRTSALHSVKRFITGNIESMAALATLCNYHYLFSNSELEDLMEKIPNENNDRDNNEYCLVLEEILFERKNPKIEIDY